MPDKALFVLLLLVCSLVVPAGATTYRWVDSRGGIHFTDDLSTIPQRYRSTVIVREDTPESATPQVIESTSQKQQLVLQPYSSGRELRKEVRKPGVVLRKRKATDESRQNGAKAGKRFSHRHPQRDRELEQSLEESKSPARKAQDQVEENLRKTRQQLDNAQSPARRAQERVEEDIRRARQGIK